MHGMPVRCMAIGAQAEADTSSYVVAEAVVHERRLLAVGGSAWSVGLRRIPEQPVQKGSRLRATPLKPKKAKSQKPKA